MSNLRKYRESLNISQTTLAKAVGCTQGATQRSLPVQVLPAFWEHQRLGALALVLVSDCLARCFKG